MFINNLQKMYADIDNLPIIKKRDEWCKLNCPPNIKQSEKNIRFREGYWDKLTKKEQDDLLKQNKDALNAENKRDQNEMIEAFSSSKHSYKDYYNIAVKSYKGVVKANPGQYVEEVPKVTFTSSNEYNKRKKLQKKALLVQAKVACDKFQTVKESNSLKFLSEGKVSQLDRGVMAMLHEIDDKGVDHYNENVKLIKKPLTEIPPIKENETLEEMTARADAMLKRESEEKIRRELLDSVLKKAFAFTEDIRNPLTDEEFVEKYSDLDKLNKLSILNEIQMANYNTIVSAFGVKPSPEVENRWKELNDEIAAGGVLFNRMGMIANPLYPEVNDFDEFVNLSKYLSEDGTSAIFDTANEIYGLDEKFGYELGQNPLKIHEWRKDKKGCEYQFSARSDLEKAAYFSYTKNSLYSIVSSVKIPSIVSDVYKIPKDKIKYSDLDGNTLDLYGAYEKMRDGKTIRVLNKDSNKFVGSLDGGTFDKWGSLKEPDTPANFKVDTADKEELEQNIKGLNNQIYESTHWYLRSSKEFKDFRLAMKELEKDGALNDRNKVKQNMKHIVDLANAYIKKKENGQELNNDTKKRLEIAHKVANSFEKTLAEASPIVELQNNQQVNQNNNHNIVNENNASRVKIEVPAANNVQIQGENVQDIVDVKENSKQKGQDIEQVPGK